MSLFLISFCVLGFKCWQVQAGDQNPRCGGPPAACLTTLSAVWFPWLIWEPSLWCPWQCIWQPGLVDSLPLAIVKSLLHVWHPCSPRLWVLSLFPYCSMGMDYHEGIFGVQIHVHLVSLGQHYGSHEGYWFSLSCWGSWHKDLGSYYLVYGGYHLPSSLLAIICEAAPSLVPSVAGPLDLAC